MGFAATSYLNILFTHLLTPSNYSEYCGNNWNELISEESRSVLTQRQAKLNEDEVNGI